MSSNIDILKAFAEKSHRKMHFAEEELPNSKIVHKSIPQYKREVSIQDNNNPNIFFILYADIFKSRGDYCYHSGVHIAIDGYEKEKFTIRKMDILDKLNSKLKNQRIRTGSGQFDRNFAIKGKSENFVNMQLSNYSLHDSINKGLSVKEYCLFGLNEMDLSYETAFDGKSGFGIYNNKKWVLDETIIETWFEVMRKIGSGIKPTTH
jgi:hypothetical protein